MGKKLTVVFKGKDEAVASWNALKNIIDNYSGAPSATVASMMSAMSDIAEPIDQYIKEENAKLEAEAQQQKLAISEGSPLNTSPLKLV